jgi:hypothetical protein
MDFHDRDYRWKDIEKARRAIVTLQAFDIARRSRRPFGSSRPSNEVAAARLRAVSFSLVVWRFIVDPRRITCLFLDITAT